MNTCSILVVDDDNLYLSLVKSIIEQTGVKARYATSGKEAVAMLKEGRFSTLITDLQMPGMDGYELALAAKGLHPELDVVMITGSKTPEVARLAGQAGISKVMAKPIGAAQIRELVRDKASAALGAGDDHCIDRGKDNHRIDRREHRDHL